MKKSLLALAALTAFVGVASAQSSVTIGGKVDLGVRKAIGSSDKQIGDAHGSRLNFGIVEDLGGGLKAIAGFEHRFNPDDGTNNGAQAGLNFWQGYSFVGFEGGFGTVRIGRYYTAAFLMAQNQFDPFGGDTVGALRGSALTIDPAKFRYANGVRYDVSSGGLNFGFDISEGGRNSAGAVDSSVVNKPYSFAVNYGAGPLFLAFGHENPGGSKDKLSTFGARYGFGGVTLRAAFDTGTNNAGAKVKGTLLGASMGLGNGTALIGVAKGTAGGVSTSKKFAVGYRYNLSKRTQIYTDVARDSVPAANKVGWDLGVQHNF